MKDRSESEEDVISQQVEAISPGKLRELLRCREAEVVVRDELVSTNLMAKRLAADGACHGTVVVACRQSGGRGRCGRSFYSPEGTGLYFTVVLRRNLSEKERNYDNLYDGCGSMPCPAKRLRQRSLD